MMSCSLAKMVPHGQGDYFVGRVREALNAARLDPSKYSGHSFHVGAAISAARAGLPDHVIKMLGRWRSEAYQLYICMPARIFGSNLKEANISRSLGYWSCTVGYVPSCVIAPLCCFLFPLNAVICLQAQTRGFGIGGESLLEDSSFWTIRALLPGGVTQKSSFVHRRDYFRRSNLSGRGFGATTPFWHTSLRAVCLHRV